jgi:hypothetical protein
MKNQKKCVLFEKNYKFIEKKNVILQMFRLIDTVWTG